MLNRSCEMIAGQSKLRAMQLNSCTEVTGSQYVCTKILQRLQISWSERLLLIIRNKEFQDGCFLLFNSEI